MAASSPILTISGQQVAAGSAHHEQDPLPSLPNFGPRSIHGNRASSVFSSDDTELYKIRSSNSQRVRRFSTATTTSIGRPRYLATRPMAKDHTSRDAATFVRDAGTQDLSMFLWNNDPSPQNWMSVPEDRHTTKRKPWYRRKTNLMSEKAILQLPDCAVATKTPKGHWYIAIHIPTSNGSNHPDDSQPRFEETEDSDCMSTTSNRFFKRSFRPRRQSTCSVSATKTSNVIQPSRRLTKTPRGIQGNLVYRQSLITDFVEHSDIDQRTTVKPTQAIITNAASALHATSTAAEVIPSMAPSRGVSAQSISLNAVGIVTANVLEQAHRESKVAKASILRAEQVTQNTILALEVETKTARTTLKGTKAAVAQAIENGDLDAASTAAKKAAEAQVAIMTAEQQISTSNMLLEKLLCASNIRLALVQTIALSVSKELNTIALAELRVEQERLMDERSKDERIAVFGSVVREILTKESDETLASSNIEDTAEENATLSKTDQLVAKAHGLEVLQLVEGKSEAGNDATVPVSSSLVTCAPEVSGLESRMRKMEEKDQMMMQALSAIVNMGKGFEELAKTFAGGMSSRSDSGIDLHLRSEA
jgi:hypothetical protein